jgi:hypothetical protein
MRTTISLDDGIAEDVRRRAAEQGVSVSALIETLVRSALHQEAGAVESPPFRLVTVSGGGPRPGVDLDRAAKIADEDDTLSGGLSKAGR